MAVIDEMVRRMTNRQGVVFTVVEELFAVTTEEMPKPSVVIIDGSTNVESEYNVEGKYVEEEGKIIVNPRRIVEVGGILRQYGAFVNPIYQAVRILASGYGQHLFSSLHGFNIVETIDQLAKADERPRQYAATVTAVGIAAMIEAGVRLQHRDNLSVYIDKTIELYEDLVNTSPLPRTEEVTVQATLGIAFAMGKTLHEKGVDFFRDFVRMDLEDAAGLAEELYLKG